ncbi:hypothetical protein C8J57DRAFT_1236657 [Mycena rebaudengoi]|nr:hypothetical protein C8J57DRAFT_1236657 [Mycena rebaudengoi]
MRCCDNMQCNNLRRKQEHMRCGGCEKMFYCSEVCQIADCRDGAYKEACAHLQTLSLSEPETVGTRDRSFLWAVAHHDHLVEWGTLLLHRVLNILEDKCGGQPEILRFTLLDYTSGDVKVRPDTDIVILQWLRRNSRRCNGVLTRGSAGLSVYLVLS